MLSGLLEFVLCVRGKAVEEKFGSAHVSTMCSYTQSCGFTHVSICNVATCQVLFSFTEPLQLISYNKIRLKYSVISQIIQHFSSTNRLNLVFRA